MIMCHNNYLTLLRCLSLLDDVRNDIYIHVDLKSKDFPYEVINKAVSRAQMTFVKRHRVTWGGYSMIEAELELLKEATKKEHAYYHLLSGTSMPLRTQDEIYAFFENSDNNYIYVSKKLMAKKSFLDRVRYYHFFCEITGKESRYFYRMLRLFDYVSMLLQKLLVVDRIPKTKVDFKGGSQWFSITHDFAKYVVSKEEFIRKHFSWGFCVDELFLQTLVYNSPFSSTIINDNLHLIDWNRGWPYTYTFSDFDEIVQSKKLFARKFSDKHIDLVDKIYHFITDNH